MCTSLKHGYCLICQAKFIPSLEYGWFPSIYCAECSNKVYTCSACGVTGSADEMVFDHYFLVDDRVICNKCDEIRIAESNHLFNFDIWRGCAEAGRCCGVDKLCDGCSAFGVGEIIRSVLYPADSEADRKLKIIEFKPKPKKSKLSLLAGGDK